MYCTRTKVQEGMELHGLTGGPELEECRVGVDSRAAVSAVPADWFPHHPRTVAHGSANGIPYRTACGGKVYDEGQQDILVRRLGLPGGCLPHAWLPDVVFRRLVPHWQWVVEKACLLSLVFQAAPPCMFDTGCASPLYRFCASELRVHSTVCVVPMRPSVLAQHQ